MPDDDVAFLKRVLAKSEDEALWAMIDFCSDVRQGIHVGDNFVDWPELSPLLQF